MLIANIADVHFGPGKTYQDVKRCWEWALSDMADRGVDIVNIAGDLFDKPVIGASALSTGEIYSAVINPIIGFLYKSKAQARVYIIPGNHDYGLPGQAHAAQPLESIPGVSIINEPFSIKHDGAIIAYLPWLSRAWFLTNAGLSESDPDEAFRSRLSAILNGFACPERPRVPSLSRDRGGVEGSIILIAHAQVKSAWLNASTQCAGGDMLLDPADLDVFDHVALGDFHRRQKYYIGALCQHNFGEEGNLSGYELITLNPERACAEQSRSIEGESKDISISWIPCPVAPNYRTLDISSKSDLKAVKKMGEYDRLKLRIQPEFEGDLDALRGLAEKGVIIERVAEHSELLRTAETLQDDSRDNPESVLEFWARHSGVNDNVLSNLKSELASILSMSSTTSTRSLL